MTPLPRSRFPFSPSDVFSQIFAHWKKVELHALISGRLVKTLPTRRRPRKVPQLGDRPNGSPLFPFVGFQADPPLSLSLSQPLPAPNPPSPSPPPSLPAGLLEPFIRPLLLPSSPSPFLLAFSLSPFHERSGETTASHRHHHDAHSFG